MEIPGNKIYKIEDSVMQRVSPSSVPFGNDSVGAGVYHHPAPSAVITILLMAECQAHIFVLKIPVLLAPQLVGAGHQGLEVLILVEVARPVGWVPF